MPRFGHCSVIKLSALTAEFSAPDLTLPARAERTFRCCVGFSLDLAASHSAAFFMHAPNSRGVRKALVAVARIVPDGPFPWDEADRMFALLVKRAAELADRRPSPGTPEDEEFDRLVSAIEAYEAKRWPDEPPRRRRPG
jgi:hypothetical protein